MLVGIYHAIGSILSGGSPNGGWDPNVPWDVPWDPDLGVPAVYVSVGEGVGVYVPVPEDQDCEKQLSPYEVDFVKQHYDDSVSLGSLANIPDTWVLGWAAEESDYGGHSKTAAIRRNPNNYFSWHGAGDAKCPPGANHSLGCFSSFYSAGAITLFSTFDNFHYGDLTAHVQTAFILADQFGNGALPAQAFSALEQAGYNSDSNYGNKVSDHIDVVASIEKCLKSKGELK